MAKLELLKSTVLEKMSQVNQLPTIVQKIVKSENLKLTESDTTTKVKKPI